MGGKKLIDFVFFLSVVQIVAALTILLQPGLILIDNGHFQYVLSSLLPRFLNTFFFFAR